MDSREYVIVGGGLAGGRASEGARQVDDRGSILLLTQEPHRPYQRPPLSKGYLRGEQGLDRVYLQPESYYPDHRLEVRTGVRVVELLPRERRLRLDDGSVIGYGRLLLATGGRARRLELPGGDLPGVHTLRTIEDSDAIRAAAGQATRAVVLGGGFIGAEVAASLAMMGKEVTMVFPEAWLQGRLVPEDLGQHLHRFYRERGVTILPGDVAVAVEGREQVERVALSQGRSLPADIVVMGVGILLNTELAHAAGLEVDRQGAIVVDERLRTSDPHIYAAGDIASWPDPTFGRRLRLEHWSVARGQGAQAGRNMAGAEEPYTAFPSFMTVMFDLAVRVWGDLETWEATVRRGLPEEGSFAYFYFREGRLVGALGSGLPEEEETAVPALVQRRPRFDEVAAMLADPQVSLAELPA
ncbi:MAG: FAD-dependent oxidoreductase [Anaerolineae bacterium]|nr:FAD-dependent oxidoreductase [Anaerolineae bacterium]